MPAPAVTREDSVSRLWKTGGGSCSPPSPSSPISYSPPPQRLSRSSTLTLLDRRYLASSPPPPEPDQGFLDRIIGWYPSFCFRFIRELSGALIYLLWSQLLFVGPAFWLSAWLWLFWKTVKFPLSVVKYVLTLCFTSASERNRKKRTVLISGGSTVQTIHLARNFCSSGARVVVFEVEGLFALARFSTAVHKFYTVPKPLGDRAEEYVEAVKEIASRERAGYYIPVSATTPAYYDALVKPHLELLGCSSFCPGLKEVCVLDDAYELLRRCQVEGMCTPLYYPILCKDDIYRLYDDETLRYGKHIMMSIGPVGCRERSKMILPRNKREFKAPPNLSPERPWVVIRDYPGDHFVTCTTVKESQVIASVTCRVESGRAGSLVPVDHPEIELWIKQLFQKLRFLRPITGHMSFRFVEQSTSSGTVVPIGCKVGVALPYICYTSVHPRLVWKPCPHFSRQNSGPLVSPVGRYWMPDALIDALKHVSVEAVGQLIGTVLDKREALFSYWDPLPYLAHYHIQLPLNHVQRILQGHQALKHSFHLLS